MSSFKSFDPSTYICADHTLCKKLEEEIDLLNTTKLVKKFSDYLKDSDNSLHQGIFSVLASVGEGKTFFLALLYCKLFNEDYKVHYINTLDYIVQDNELDIEEEISNLSNPFETTVVLIDNIEKHKQRFILDFIYTLNKLSRSKNLLFVLAYDDAVVQNKLRTLFGKGDDSEYFFQNYIDFEFYLFNGNFDKVDIKQLFGENDRLVHYAVEYIYDKVINSKQLTLMQRIILAKKIEFFLRNNSEEVAKVFLKAHISKAELSKFDPKYMVIISLPYVVFLMALKLVKKDVYKSLLFKHSISFKEDIIDNKYILEYLKRIVLETDDMLCPDGYTENLYNLIEMSDINLKPLLIELELIHV